MEIHFPGPTSLNLTEHNSPPTPQWDFGTSFTKISTACAGTSTSTKAGVMFFIRYSIFSYSKPFQTFI